MPSVCNEIIDDIEDLVSAQDITPKERYSTRRAVTYRAKKRHGDINSIAAPDDALLENNDSFEIPGTANIFVKTWGCTHNSSDSEYMAGQLAAYGYKLTSTVYFMSRFIKQINDSYIIVIWRLVPNR